MTNEPVRPTVGFIGLGSMGSGMTRNLQRAGYRLVVNDVRQETARTLLSGGGAWCDTAADVAAASDVVITMLPTPRQVSEVLDGIRLVRRERPRQVDEQAAPRRSIGHRGTNADDEAVRHHLVGNAHRMAARNSAVPEHRGGTSHRLGIRPQGNGVQCNRVRAHREPIVRERHTRLCQIHRLACARCRPA